MSSQSTPRARVGRLLQLGRVLAPLTAACLAWAAVADNAVVCPDDGDVPGEARHGTPAGPHGCVTAPCHTPVVVIDAIASASPATAVVEHVTLAPAALTGIDAPAPPTHPPTAFD